MTSAIIAALLLAPGLPALCAPALPANQPASPPPMPAPYRVTFQPLINDGQRVKDGWKFTVKLRVTNTSPFPQTFSVMSCSWIESWHFRPVTSMTGIYVNFGEGFACTANAPMPVTLKPSETYEKQTLMCLWSTKSQRTVNVVFQIGFVAPPVSLAEPHAGTTPGQAIPIYWSDKMAIAVVK